jgi:two-component system, NtrC family, sensor kinase
MTAAKVAFDLEQFTLQDMTECGVALRKLGADALGMEDVAQRTVSYLFDTLIGRELGGNACALVRFFVTAPYGQLPQDVQACVRKSDPAVQSSTPCLVLLGTRGIKPEWNDRRLADSHQAMPLNAADLSDRVPMVGELMLQLGRPMTKLEMRGRTRFLVDERLHNYNVLYAPDPINDCSLTTQEEFIAPNEIKSVVGYGGLLPSANSFAVILFLLLPMTHQAALAFRPFALNTKIALLSFDEPSKMFRQGT